MNNDSEKLWDEILKAIVGRMPKQILPLIEDVFGTSYPDDVSITLLPTEATLPKTEDFKELTSIYSDIALKIGSDIYHLESQINNDDDMAIRMVKYDFIYSALKARHRTLPIKKHQQYSADVILSFSLYFVKNQNRIS